LRDLFLSVSVERVAPAIRNIEAGRIAADGAAGRTVAAARNRRTSKLGAGDFGLCGISGTCRLRHVPVVVVMACGLGNGRNREHGESECKCFHRDLFVFPER
jgi:hypothetical protein